jgi:L-malate glycosyltransferase
VKVLYFSDNTSGHNQRFLEKLAQAGLGVWFLDPTSKGVAENWLPEGVRWVQSKQLLPKNSEPEAFVQFLPEFLHIVDQLQPDIIHSGPIQTCGYLTALSQFHPWLLTSWGSDLLLDADRNRQWAEATRIALAGADSFFCDCDTVRERAGKFAAISGSRIVQFPWGLKKGSFAPDVTLPPAATYRPETGTHVFISTRSWEPLYNIDTLLSAFLQAYRKSDFLRLLLLGNGSDAGQVQEFIHSNRLSRVIQTPGVGTKDEMPKWFRAAHSYISCAQSDGTSVSLLEAMATGLPVIVTDIPSNREWVTEGMNGWLAPASASGEFADRMLRAAQLTPQDRELFSRRNQRLIDGRANWDRNFPKLLEMYETITGIPIDTREIAATGEK